MRPLNLLIKFLLELGALAAFAYWATYIGSGAFAVILAVLAPLAAAVVWGAFAAPRATRRLPLPARIPLEMAVFGLAVVALIVAAPVSLAIVFGAVAVVNAVLLSVFHQWES